MVSTNTYAPSREDFAALLDESYGRNEAFEGSVVKGIVVAIEKDVAVIDSLVGAVHQRADVVLC